MSDRRELEFSSMDEVVAEVDRLAAGEVRTTGNHSFPQILRHLALSNDMVTGKVEPPKPPLMMRLVMPFIRSSIINGPVKPGFKLPAKAEAFFWPEEPGTVAEAATHLKESVENFKQKGPLPVHPIFGPATAEQVESMGLKHAAMHLSFVHPA